MTYPPVKHAGPLEPRNLAFIIVVSIVTALQYGAVQVFLASETRHWALYAVGPISIFLWHLPPPLSEWKWWLRRLVWWSVAIAAGLAVFAGSMLLTKGGPQLSRLFMATVLANVVWTFVLFYTVERRDDMRAGKLLLVSVIFGLITGASYWVVNALIR